MVPAQTYSDSTVNYIEIGAFGGSGSRTPFWMQANQFGTIPKSSPAATLRSGFEKYIRFGSHKNRAKNVWRAGFGIEAVGNLTESSKLLFPQLHATLRFKNWEIFAGRKKQWVGLADSTLGTGSYAWSGNAMPIPKIQIGTIGFVNVPFTQGWLSFNAFYSDGFFENNRPVTSGLKLHQKALYLKIGNKYSRLKLLGGFNHQVQWGGKSPYYTKDGKLPDGFKNYINVITGQRYFLGDDLTEFDYNNRIGNHLGSIDLGIQYIGHEYSWFIYRQNIYEDGSLSKLLNIADGLNGISIRKNNSYGANFEVSAIVVEFLFTKSQGGSVWDLETVLGRDNYFNNGQIRDGWSYFDRTIGTPFITPTSDTNWKWPGYSDSFTSNNRVSVFHFGFSGTFLQKIQWSSKLSYSSNIGTYDEPFLKKPSQFSGIFSVGLSLDRSGNTAIKASYALDIGQLYPNAKAFGLSLRRDFGFRSPVGNKKN
ncbi:capsule assembly Wzi family protein [Dyadobacter frigoris]|uniref:Capsule assembly Wzi family protein n=2 Tax=Dyadobacter frigoris TaxID=2576211 RepID=A0A4U6D870_9BACT|nr:capsule assembly Wzi family protein [Dyadobacter frigoris]